MEASQSGYESSDGIGPPMTPDLVYINGYLFKKTRTGKWQKRWFETTGCFLTYYKSKRMTRLLAALNLPQVGKIALVKKEEAEADDVADVGCLFSITLGDRDYLLKATDPESAQKWVDTLSQLKEGANSAATPEATNPVGPTPDPEPATASGAWEKKGRRGALFGCC